MLTPGIKGQCILVLGTEADTTTEAVFINVFVNCSRAVKAGQIAIFEHINGPLARFSILEVTVHSRRVQSGCITGTELQIQVGAGPLAGQCILTFLQFDNGEHVTAIKVQEIVFRFYVV